MVLNAHRNHKIFGEYFLRLLLGSLSYRTEEEPTCVVTELTMGSTGGFCGGPRREPASECGIVQL